MNTISLVLGLLMAVAVLAWLASRWGISYPILLVIGGLALSLIPNLPTPRLDTDLVFLLFLPPLLYRAGMLTSWREFTANWQPIALLAVGLVIVTTAVVAVAAWGFIQPTMTLAAALVLGAIISPPDAIAVTAITRRLHVPKRVMVVLEGESLLNDATALVLYAFAVHAAVTGRFQFVDLTWQVPYVAIGGIAVGLLVGSFSAAIRRYVDDCGVLSLVSLLTPFAAYLPAELLHASGVLAAVTAGIVVNRHGPQLLSPRARIQLNAVWETLVFLLNGLVFILLGLQLRTVLENLQQQSSLPLVLWYAALVSIAAIVVRIVFVFSAAYVARLLPRWVLGSASDPPPGSVMVVAWSGMRGVVSMAAALALPLTTRTGDPFPHRDLIIFISFGVILATLVLQGLSLPGLIRRLKLSVDRTEEFEEATARYESAHAAVARLEQIAEERGVPEDLLDRVRWSYEDRILAFARHMIESETTPRDLPLSSAEQRLRAEGVAAERAHLLAMRRERLISDDVMRRIMEELDMEDARNRG